jgi:hypothetical protein
MKCEKCNKEHDGSYGSGRFCNIKCANSRGPRTNEFKKNVSKKLTINKYCISCNTIVTRRSKYCLDCVNLSYNKIIYNRLGINIKNFKEANELAVSIIEEEYFNNYLSTPQIFEKYNIQPISLSRFLKKNNINLRSLSESISNAFFTGRKNIQSGPQFKHGLHKTWFGENIFYRSSYELEYAKYLDNERIKYEVESLRIKYFDSQLKKERTAIPDFYLPDTNTIVEIKSNWTLDRQNMKDKEKACKDLGYKFKLKILTS